MRTTSHGQFPRWVVNPHRFGRTSAHPDWDLIPAGHLPAGTILARAEPGGRKVIARSDSTEPAVGILLTDALATDRNFTRAGYAMFVGGVVYQDLLPDSDNDNFATWIAELETAGVTTAIWGQPAQDTTNPGDWSNEFDLSFY